MAQDAESERNAEMKRCLTLDIFVRPIIVMVTMVQDGNEWSKSDANGNDDNDDNDNNADRMIMKHCTGIGVITYVAMVKSISSGDAMQAVQTRLCLLYKPFGSHQLLARQIKLQSNSWSPTHQAAPESLQLCTSARCAFRYATIALVTGLRNNLGASKEDIEPLKFHVSSVGWIGRNHHRN